MNKDTSLNKDSALGKHKWLRQLNRVISKLDCLPLWWIGILLIGVIMTPYIILGEGSVFPYHDQLDETMMAYVLNARHLWNGEGAMLPELLGGIQASGLQPSAVLFVPLYRFLPAFQAFMVQYLIVSLCGFFGMYGSVKEMTDSSILAAAAAGAFSLLPIPPVYGLSVAGVPLLLYCFLCIYQRKRMAGSFLGIFFFGLTTHLVLIGYVVLSLWLLAVLWLLVKRKCNGFMILAGGWLTGIYVWVNRSLFIELLLGKNEYVSHREEFVNYVMPFWKTAVDVFLNSAQHAPSLHRRLILPILLLLVLGFFLRKRMGERERWRLWAACVGMALLAGIALLYAIFHSAPVVELKNGCSGIVRYFRMDRFYWIYPAGWYLEFALCFSLWWNYGDNRQKDTHEFPEKKGLVLKTLVLACLMLSLWQVLKPESYLYLNINQINNGSGITGYITWEDYYAEDLMARIEEVIGRNPESYRVAHLGMSPAPSLMHGFYIVDGYSNNYPMEYKHQFRRVIARELEKNEQTRLYFDEWGSRCYLFNGATGNAWMLGKRAGIQYEGLEFDMDALKELGCEYIFSAGEILDSDRMGLTYMGFYETEDSYWGIWLYQL